MWKDVGSGEGMLNWALVRRWGIGEKGQGEEVQGQERGSW